MSDREYSHEFLRRMEQLKNAAAAGDIELSSADFMRLMDMLDDRSQRLMKANQECSRYMRALYRATGTDYHDEGY